MVEFIKSCKDYLEYPPSNKEFLLVGRSNVGKSSIINALYNQKIAYVGKTPGKTRMLNFFEVDDYTFTDAPGYGFAKRDFDEQEEYRLMMEDYFTHRVECKMVVLLVDARRVTEDDIAMMDFLRHYSYKVITIMTKADKLKRNDINKAKTMASKALGLPLNAILLSDKERTDYNALRKHLENELNLA